MSRKLQQELDQYFRGEAKFSSRRQSDQPPESLVDTLFLPYLNSLDVDSQEEIIRMLGELAVGDHYSNNDRRSSEALWILNRLKYPWPIDHRKHLRLLGPLLKAEFVNEGNLSAWMHQPAKSIEKDFRHSLAYAKMIYTLLCVILPKDSEIRKAAQSLIENCQNRRFAKQLHQIPHLVNDLDIEKAPLELPNWVKLRSQKKKGN